MYQKPSLQRFGSFRELTQIGINSNVDGSMIFGVVTSSSPGNCVLSASGPNSNTFTCVRTTS